METYIFSFTYFDLNTSDPESYAPMLATRFAVSGGWSRIPANIVRNKYVIIM